MSAFDPKRTLGLISVWPNYAAFLPRLRLQSARLWASRGPSRRAHAAARVHHTSWRRGCRVADLCVRSTSEVADNRISGHGRTVGMDPLDRRLCPADT